MKKKTDMKTNLIKYLNPSRINNDKRTNLSNAHCRSMQQLDLNQLCNKQNENNVHHSSVFSQCSDMNETQSIKSKSLTKFMALFQNSNILNQENAKTNSKKKVYNGFTYDLKIGAHKKKDEINGQQNRGKIQNKSTLVLKKQKYQSQSNELSIDLMTKMKNLIQQLKQKQKNQQAIIQSLQRQNLQLREQFMNLQQKLNKIELHQGQLMKKLKHFAQQNKMLKAKQNQSLKCKQHNLVIQSLKKVINQQLNKIIEFQRKQLQLQMEKQQMNSSKYQIGRSSNNSIQSPMKTESQQWEKRNLKAENKIIHQKNSIFQQLQSPGNNSLIKIRQDEEDEHDHHSAIQSITEQTQENDSEYAESAKKQLSLFRKDKILDEVNEYLSNFRKK